jgi:L-seryl-tRNA(Ser) seleniumtransferase
VIVHTNLGRAPLAEEALARVLEVGRGYSNLEYDLDEGTRGSRQDHVAPILRKLTGAEAALVVNNNAGAVLLSLAALAEGRDVIVSRGELIEIGDASASPTCSHDRARLSRSGRRTARAPPTRTAPRCCCGCNFRLAGHGGAAPEEVAAVAHWHGLPSWPTQPGVGAARG